jgi:hypothetical protein
MKRHRRLIALVGALGVAALMGSARADLTKCQASIEKNSNKLRGAIWKALSKCKNGYQKAVAKGEALNLGAGPTCQTLLSKAIDAANPLSTMAKIRAALDLLVTNGVCTDADLLILGHLPPGTFSDHWSRWLALAALKAAYEEQVWFVGPTANIFQALASEGCALCDLLGRPPCQRSSCALVPGDGLAPLANSEAETKVLGGALTTHVGLSGELITEGCQWPGLTNNNEIAVIGGPSVSINPGSVLGLTACTLTIRSGGFTNCGAGGIPNTSVSTCQDSRLDDAGGNECPGFLGAGALCLANPDANTGGLCVKFTTAAGTPGSSIALATSQIRTVGVGQEGPDGVACTADDTAPPTPPNTIPITTGTVQADTFDAGNTDGNQISEGPVAGAAGPGCAQLQAGTLTGLTLVGTFPGADTVGSPLGDTVTATRLQCQ